MILLNMLVVDIGFYTPDIQEKNEPAKGLGISSLIWCVMRGLIALFVARWAFEKLVQTQRFFDGMLHRLLTWYEVTLVSE